MSAKGNAKPVPEVQADIRKIGRDEIQTAAPPTLRQSVRVAHALSRELSELCGYIGEAMMGGTAGYERGRACSDDEPLEHIMAQICERLDITRKAFILISDHLVADAPPFGIPRDASGEPTALGRDV